MTQVRERKSSSSSIVSRFGKRGFAGLAAGSTLAVVAAVSAGAWWMSAGPTAPATAARTINVNDVFNVDAVHSSVVFSVSYADAAPFFGRFNTIGGSFFLDEANAAASSVEIRLDPASVDSNNQGRDRHLRNADFFNVGEFNTLAFKSKQVAPSAKTSSKSRAISPCTARPARSPSHSPKAKTPPHETANHRPASPAHSPSADQTSA